MTTTIGERGGRGLVRLARSRLALFGLAPGETVRVSAAAGGARATHGRVVPAALPEDVAELDPILAGNAGLGTGDTVAIAPASLPPLQTLALRIDGGTAAHADIKDALFDMALTLGDRITLTLPAARASAAEVIATTPGPAGVVDDATALSVETTAPAYDGIGGMSEEIARVHEMVAAPLTRPDLYAALGIEAPRGVLFAGPPGSGKTLLARAVAARTRAAFFQIDGPEIVSKHYGDSEAALRRTFTAAQRATPAIIFIDEIDAIAPARASLSGDRQVERRIVAQLLTLMDGLSDRGRVIVMAATNQPDALDPALRRPGRFDREIVFRPPQPSQRRDILAVHLARAPLGPDADLERLAAVTHGYVGADLASLAREAAVAALARASREAGGEAHVRAENLRITAADLDHGLAVTGPSALRGAGPDLPPVAWRDVGGLDAAKAALELAVLRPLRHTVLHDRLRVAPARGILLSGPPGTGKTLLARALAAEAGMNVIAVRPPRILSRYFGEAERAIAEVFATARATAPTLLFFDEFDALAPRRGGGGEVHDRIVAQLLTEFDAVSVTRGVVVLAATNRAGAIDSALTRPGRFDLVVPVPLPDMGARAAILSVHLKDRPVAPDVNLAELAEMTGGFSGADLAGLVDMAALGALERALLSGETEPCLTREDLVAACARIAAAEALRRQDFINGESHR
ncbi:AAA family ATPase [Roseivivax isoporae]|uniref:AAA family ATPase n=1 Tax=Roseivivax isoporae TaxID=591206 RepID=UPI0005C21B73|nr:AAA family ATPase [Roseivivax isoporae]